MARSEWLAGAVLAGAWSVMRAESDRLEPGLQSFVLAAKFEQRDPGIRIHLRHVDFADVSNDAIRAIAGGNGSDLVTIDNLGVALFASHGGFLDLSLLIARSLVIDTKRFFPRPLAS